MSNKYMKQINVLICVIICHTINAQVDSSKFPFKSAISVSPKYINGYKVHSISFDSFFLDKVHNNKSKISMDKTYPKVYFTNKSKKEYIEIYSGPDIGFGQFYCIGYTRDSSCGYCGDYLGDMNFSNFSIYGGVHLGDDVDKIEDKLKLSFFRTFTYGGLTFYYYEGSYLPYYIPPEPDGIVYYKFRDNKLVEIGFGYGFTGINPMFQEK